MSCVIQLLVAASIPWLMATSFSSLPPWSHELLLFCLSQISFCLSLIRTLLKPLSAHSCNPRQSPPLKFFNLITPAKAAIQRDNHRIQRLGGEYFEGLLLSPPEPGTEISKSTSENIFSSRRQSLTSGNRNHTYHGKSLEAKLR